MTPEQTRVAELRGRLIRTLRAELPPVPKRWALLPAPLHGNVGDSAIFLGTIDALRELGWPRPTVVSDMHTFDPGAVSRRLRGGPILFMGGGNFGDLYPLEHRVRERALAELPDHPAVQLPQSIHFGTAEAAGGTLRALTGRPELPLLLRDEASMEWAREHLPGTRPVLCPDLAFGLGTLPRTAPTMDVLRLLRRDRESSRDHGGDERDGHALDWLADGPDRSIAAERRLRDLGIRHPHVLPVVNRLRERLHGPMAAARLRRGLTMLGRGRVVITDRLHGHVLCVLMGIPHAVLEDRHGKVAAFVGQWTADLPTVRLCRTPGEAEQAAEHLLREHGT